MNPVLFTNTAVFTRPRYYDTMARVQNLLSQDLDCIGREVRFVSVEHVSGFRWTIVYDLYTNPPVGSNKKAAFVKRVTLELNNDPRSKD